MIKPTMSVLEDLDTICQHGQLLSTINKKDIFQVLFVVLDEKPATIIDWTPPEDDEQDRFDQFFTAIQTLPLNTHTDTNKNCIILARNSKTLIKLQYSVNAEVEDAQLNGNLLGYPKTAIQFYQNTNNAPKLVERDFIKSETEYSVNEYMTATQYTNYVPKPKHETIHYTIKHNIHRYEILQSLQQLISQTQHSHLYTFLETTQKPSNKY